MLATMKTQETNMILFDVKGKVLSREDRSIPKRDGSGAFEFTEITIESDDKQGTKLVARLLNKEMTVQVYGTYTFKIGLGSNEGRDGRIWNNFVVMAFKGEGNTKAAPVTDYEPIDDDLPF